MPPRMTTLLRSLATLASILLYLPTAQAQETVTANPAALMDQMTGEWVMVGTIADTFASTMSRVRRTRRESSPTKPGFISPGTKTMLNMSSCGWTIPARPTLLPRGSGTENPTAIGSHSFGSLPTGAEFIIRSPTTVPAPPGLGRLTTSTSPNVRLRLRESLCDASRHDRVPAFADAEFHCCDLSETCTEPYLHWIMGVVAETAPVLAGVSRAIAIC